MHDLKGLRLVLASKEKEMDELDRTCSRFMIAKLALS